jgi:NifB/MoaA-like Fe-S oxidoreductase
LQENGLGMVRDFLDEWQFVKEGLESVNATRRLTLATGALFAPALARAAAEFAGLTGVAVEVVPIVNQRLGETITVAGLLMGQDIICQLRGRDLGDLLVLPHVTFDHPDGIALDDVSPDQIAQALERPVALADTMGDVWEAIMGRRVNA